jgi:hypothetical protein
MLKTRAQTSKRHYISSQKQQGESKNAEWPKISRLENFDHGGQDSTMSPRWSSWTVRRKGNILCKRPTNQLLHTGGLSPVSYEPVFVIKNPFHFQHFLVRVRWFCVVHVTRW